MKEHGGAHLAPAEKKNTFKLHISKHPQHIKGKAWQSEGKHCGDNISEQHEQTSEPKKKLSGKKIALLAAVAFLLLLTATIALFVNSKLNLLNYSDGVSSGTLSEEQRTEVDISGLEQWEEPIAVENPVVLSNDGIFNVLLLGTDGLDVEFVDNARSDAILLLSMGLDDKTIKLTSFQRGIGVPIQSGEWEGHYDLITHIFAHGGASMMMKVVRECFGVDVYRYVRVNFTALINVIDVIGGVDVEITEMEAWYLNRTREGMTVAPYIDHGFIRAEGSKDHEYVVGMNHMTGSMALAYARLRAIDDDWGRIQRQRTVLQAAANKLRDADLKTLNALADEILPLVQTNLTKGEIAELILRTPGFLGVEFEQLSLPEQGSYGGMTGLYMQDMLAIDFERNSKILQGFIYGETA